MSWGVKNGLRLKENSMPEDFDLLYNTSILSYPFSVGWMEQDVYYGVLEDIDAFCCYLCISI